MLKKNSAKHIWFCRLAVWNLLFVLVVLRWYCQQNIDCQTLKKSLAIAMELLEENNLLGLGQLLPHLSTNTHQLNYNHLLSQNFYSVKRKYILRNNEIKQFYSHIIVWQNVILAFKKLLTYSVFCDMQWNATSCNSFHPAPSPLNNSLPSKSSISKSCFEKQHSDFHMQSKLVVGWRQTIKIHEELHRFYSLASMLAQLLNSIQKGFIYPIGTVNVVVTHIIKVCSKSCYGCWRVWAILVVFKTNSVVIWGMLRVFNYVDCFMNLQVFQTGLRIRTSLLYQVV